MKQEVGVGNRFASKDKRDVGRVVEVLEVDKASGYCKCKSTSIKGVVTGVVILLRRLENSRFYTKVAHEEASQD